LTILGNGVSLEPLTLVNLFATIPEELLGVMARSLHDEFRACVEKYADAIKQAIGNFGWVYAEIVARKIGPPHEWWTPR
uniref:hypothetical protein n=1 Tax=Arthrobacter sp. TaxID=1667 RepID=UPI0025830C4E